jgi:uncharacterized protein (DUF342 family)
MSFYLLHHFNPDFNHLKIIPVVGADGQADRHDLGYTQNVVKGQVIAEIVPLEEVKNPDPRFMLPNNTFPQGKNTRVSPDYSHYLLADVNGYVFYLHGLITVKNVLNVHGNVDFHTGNIFFVGNMAVQDNVKAGFKVQANDVLIKGAVEGGTIRSRRDMAIQKGVRGGARDSSLGRCMLDCGNNLRVSHVEMSEVRARGKLIIDRFSLNSTICAGNNLLVQGRLQGGVCHVKHIAYIHDSLGNKHNIPTRVNLGHDPFVVLELGRCESWIKELSARAVHYSSVAGRQSDNGIDFKTALSSVRYKLSRLQQRRARLLAQIENDTEHLPGCRLVVVGKVFPGVEVYIGKSALTVKYEMEHVLFQLHDDDVIAKPLKKPVSL